MKCKYCNSELKQGAKFCPNCGKVVSESDVCISCGQKIKIGASFCPHCGANQHEQVVEQETSKEDAPITEKQQVEKLEQQTNESLITQESPILEEDAIPSLEDKKSSKKWIWIICVLLLCVVGGGGYYYANNQAKDNFLVQEIDSIAENEDSVMTTDEEAEMMNAMAARNQAMEETMIDERIEFIKLMYEDFFENHNFNIESAANLKKYLAPNVMERILIECPYDGCEGEKSYIVDCFRDGSLSYERPDYGDKVVKREINSIDSEWFEVANYWDVIKEPVKIKIKIGSDDNGNYKVIDFR